MYVAVVLARGVEVEGGGEGGGVDMYVYMYMHMCTFARRTFARRVVRGA